MSDSTRMKVLDAMTVSYNDVIEDPELLNEATVSGLVLLRTSINKLLKTQNPVMGRGTGPIDVGTPPELLHPIQFVFGNIAADMAGSEENHVCDRYFSPADDSLSPGTKWPLFKQPWVHSGRGRKIMRNWLWLNPPYGNLRDGTWLSRCTVERDRGRSILCLIPTSSGRWWTQHVEGQAWIFPLVSRPQFVGYTASNARDIALLIYSNEWSPVQMFEGLTESDAAAMAECLGFGSRFQEYTRPCCYCGPWDWKKAGKFASS